MAEDYNNSIEFENVENFSQGEKHFSHQVLVMKCMNKAIDAGCIEMKEGGYEHKMDRAGNVQNIYISDTRRAFIEAVKTTKAIMACDFDEEAKEKIGKLLEEMKENKQKWLNLEENWWATLSWKEREEYKKKRIYFLKGYHNQKLQFKDDSLYEEVEIWRNVLEELNQLTKRIGYYESDKFEG